MVDPTQFVLLVFPFAARVILLLFILLFFIYFAYRPTRKREEGTMFKNYKSLFFTILLSIAPGGGHVYIGQVKKGLLFYLYFLGFQVVFVFFPYLYFLLIIYVAIIMVDGVMLAKRMNDGHHIMRGECWTAITEVLCTYLVEPPVFSYNNPEYAPYTWIVKNYEGDIMAAILRKREVTGQRMGIVRASKFKSALKYVEPEDEIPEEAQHVNVVTSAKPVGLPSDIPTAEIAYFRAIHSYKSRQEGELSYKVGEEVDLLKEETDGYWAGWWLVRKKDMSVGYASSMYFSSV